MEFLVQQTQVAVEVRESMLSSKRNWTDRRRKSRNKERNSNANRPNMKLNLPHRPKKPRKQL